MRRIKSFDSWLISEGLWKSGINRAKIGQIREEDAFGHHEFTDGNGKFHKNGVLIDSDDGGNISDQISDYIIELWSRNPDLDAVIDLNFIDMSGAKTVYHLFGRMLMRLDMKMRKLENGLGYKDIAHNLKIDTSGWNLENCLDFGGVLENWQSDCGADGWKVNPNVTITLSSFNDSYYESHYPKWFKLDPKEWAAKVTRNSMGSYTTPKVTVDKVRTKETGEKCYNIEFGCGVRLVGNVPDSITITKIWNKEDIHLSIDASKITTFRGLPSKIDYNNHGRKHQVCTLIIRPENITDDEIIIPEGVGRLNVGDDIDLSKLPKKLPCDLIVRKPEQLFYFDEIDGNVLVQQDNRNPIFSSLKGCPKVVTGYLNLEKQNITDLEGCSEYVGSLYCGSNKHLTSLKGCPKRIEQDFILDGSAINEIDAFPEYVGGTVSMQALKLKSFVGLPDTIEGDLNISDCDVESLDGLPTEIKGRLLMDRLTLNGERVKVEDIKNLYTTLTNF